MLGSLAALGIVQLLAALSFGYVGHALQGGRSATSSAADAGARMAFVAWWWGLGLDLALGAFAAIGAAFGFAPLPAFVALSFAVIPLLCLAAWGIAYYVGYLYTGRTSLGWVFGAYYALVGVAFVWVTFAAHPTSVRVDAFAAKLAPPSSAINIVYGLFAVPLLGATIGYLTLVPRVREPLKRYRISLSGGAVLFWVLGGLITNVAAGDLARFLGVTGLGLLTAAALILAYHPPRAVIARLDPRSPQAAAYRRESASHHANFVARATELLLVLP